MEQQIKISVFRKDENGNIFVLLEPIEIEWQGKSFIVPKGVKSNGCIAPRHFWVTVSPAIATHTLRGAIAHDFIYRTLLNNRTRKEADEMFHTFIKEYGLNWLRADIAYYEVKLFRGSSWNGK